MSTLPASTLIAARDGLLRRAGAFFSSEPGVVGVFLGGSLPAGRSDVYSDIDLRVVVSRELHQDFVARRLNIPAEWEGFLFNEWLDDAIHCVSHFRPFLKIDIFYLDESTFRPSPWLTLPLTILHDPRQVIAQVVADSVSLDFEVSESEIDRSIGKGIAAAHEAYRRVKRGELIYAQSLLDELRLHIIRADDWLNDRTQHGDPLPHLNRRLNSDLSETLSRSFVRTDPTEIEKSLVLLGTLYQSQVAGLHSKYRLSRAAHLDLEAVEIPVRLATYGIW